VVDHEPHERTVVSINGQVTRQGEYVDYGKNETAEREIPVPEEWRAMLERYRAERALQGYNVGPDAYVFCTKTGRPARPAQRPARAPARAEDGPHPRRPADVPGPG
jgi:hypothetical protein